MTDIAQATIANPEDKVVKNLLRSAAAFDTALITYCPKVNELIDEQAGYYQADIADNYRGLGGDGIRTHTKKRRELLSLLICNLVRHSSVRMKRKGVIQTLGGSAVKAKALAAVVDWFVDAGLAEKKPGWAPQSGKGHLTRIYLDPAMLGDLRELLKERGIKKTAVEKKRPAGAVLIRDEGTSASSGPKYKPCDATPGTSKVRMELERYNRLLAASIVGVPKAGQKGSGLSAMRYFALGEGSTRSRPNTWLEGRYQGAEWQSIPKAKRFLISIDGVIARERDFQGFQLRLMYHLQGLEYTQDPYCIPGLSRETAKAIACRSLNCKSRNGTILAVQSHNLEMEYPKAPRRELRQPTTADYEEAVTMVERFEAHHHLIKDSLHSQTGQALMTIEARIAERVLKHFTDKGVLVLPIHDSFLCNHHLTDELEAVMSQAYQAETGKVPVIHNPLSP
jgi:hypothetical protein